MACIDPTQLARHPHPHSRDAEGGEEGDEEGDQAEGREEGQEEHEEEGHQEEGLAEEVNGAVAAVSDTVAEVSDTNPQPGVLRRHRLTIRSERERLHRNERDPRPPRWRPSALMVFTIGNDGLRFCF